MANPLDALNADVSAIKFQLNQLKKLHETGALSAQGYNETRCDLERRLLDLVLRDVPDECLAQSSAGDAVQAESESVLLSSKAGNGAAPAKPSSRAWLAVAGVAVFAALTGGAYFVGGRVSPAASSPMAGAALLAPVGNMPASEKVPPSAKVDDLSVMAEKLAIRLRSQPDDAQGWALLARSHSVLGNPLEAVKAYEKAIALIPNDAVLMADYAKAVKLASKTGNVKVSGLAPRSFDLRDFLRPQRVQP
ncbi:MAG: tetratricopeptide repeat protein [Polaromonas sp.]|nr:tetratricopeptide repeat protein [Polaromonas sp.]